MPLFTLFLHLDGNADTDSILAGLLYHQGDTGKASWYAPDDLPGHPLHILLWDFLHRPPVASAVLQECFLRALGFPVYPPATAPVSPNS